MHGGIWVAKTGKKNRSSVEFVHGEYNGYGPCVLRKSTAEAIASKGDDIVGSPTFRHYVEQCRSKSDVYDSVLIDEMESWLEESGVNLDDPLDISFLPGAEDGDFPGDARTAMLDDLPEEVFEAGIGLVHDVMGGIPRFDITETDVIRIVEVLESLGHTVHRDQSIFDRMAGP